ncbi:MAG: hypothetical protein A4E73_00339 [Syntrophaceae bacterium PtaU1.Bin231]|nr:MAG: hypothetical protein A4E73_00339 [Syntrophaceae bacterium PtaU1.Bin231]
MSGAAMNCADPAKITDDMAWAIDAGTPTWTARAP